MRYFQLLLALLIATVSVSQNLPYVKEQAEILSSAKMKGRGYVDGGLECAAKHIAKEYGRIGLRAYGPDYYQSFTHAVNTFPTAIELNIDSQVQKPGEDFLIDPSSPSFVGSLRAIVFDLSERTNLPEPIEIKEVCDSCIIVLDVRQIEDKALLKEASAIKYIYSDVAPVFWLSDAKRTWAVSDRQLSYPIIESSFPIKEGSRIVIKIDAHFKSDFESANVLGYVPGTSKSDSLVVFTAHYDHLGMMGTEACFYGANDNASGTAFLLSLAEYYATDPAEYTCVFIAFAAEEAGLKGSKYFVEHPLFNLQDIRFLINLDLMGSGKEGITVVNATANPLEFDYMQRINEELELLPKIKSRGQAANSDHYYFAESGVPAIFIYALGGSQAYHDIYDVNSNLTFDEYSDIFKLLTHLVEKL